jgi:hemerythrin
VLAVSSLSGGASVVDWNTEHATGNVEIDEQHAHIFELINAVDAAVTTGAGASTIDLVLGLLLRYLAVHFAAEERLMRAVAYPAYLEHAEHHAECSREIQRVLAEYRRGAAKLDTVLTFVRNWLHTHTLTRDKELAAFTRANATETASARA